MDIPTGQDIRAARKGRSLSQAEVAERADVSQPLLSRVENSDVDPRLTTLHRIAAAIEEYDEIVDENTLEVAVRTAFKHWRQDAGLTQAELADRAGVSQPMIARIENEDVNPRASTVRDILSALGEIDSITINRETKNRAYSDTSESPPENVNVEVDSVLDEIRASFEEI